MHAMLAVALLAAAASANAVDLHGYFRQGVGGSSKGGDQAAFSNTGQNYTLRLGNEANWSEFEFVQLIQKDKNGVEWTAGFMLGWGNGFTLSQDMVNGGSGYIDPTNLGTDEIDTGFGSLALQQEYIRATFPQLSGATVWGGKRFYHRHANDIFDYFYMNESGPGVGIEDLDTGFGKLAVAMFRFQARQPGTITPATYEPAFWMPDVRLEGIPVNPGGTLSIAALARIRSWNKELAGGKAPDKTQSFSPHLMVKHSQGNIMNGGNNLAIDYKTGCFLNDGCNENLWRLTVSEDLLIQPTKQFALNLAAIWMYDQNATKDKINGIGVGIRPLLKLADHFAIQGDAGYFYNKSDVSGSKANTMFKGTIAPTITPFTDGFAWSVRPEIRFYVTYASWNKEQNGTTGFGGGTFGPDATSGVTYGAMVDTWF
jgi:maltoporin